MTQTTFALSVNDDPSLDSMPLQVVDGSFKLSRGEGTMQVVIQGYTMEEVWAEHDQLIRMSEYMVRANPMMASGGRVVLMISMVAGQTLYADLLTMTPEVTQRYSAPPILIVTVTFTCQRYLRGSPVRVGSTGTLTNGQDSTIWLDPVPGTAPALLQLELTDLSDAPYILNRLRLGVFHQRNLTPTSFISYVRPAAGVDAQIGTGPAGNGYLVGNVFMTTITFWREFAVFSGIPRNTYDVLMRIRDNAQAPGASVSFNLQAGVSPTGGSMWDGSWREQVVAYNNAGQILAISPVVSTTLKSSGGPDHSVMTLSWDAVDGANYYQVWVKKPTFGWARLINNQTDLWETLGAVTYPSEGTPNVTPWTAGPPAAIEPGLETALVQAGGGLETPDTAVSYPARPIPRGNQVWHLLSMATDVIPPYPRGEGRALRVGRVRIYSKARGSVGNVIETSGAFFMPLPYMTVENFGMDSTIKRRWIVDSDRSGSMRSWTEDLSTGDVVDTLLVQGAITLTPGENFLVIAADIAGGVCNILQAKFSAIVTAIPRYDSFGAAPWN